MEYAARFPLASISILLSAKNVNDMVSTKFVRTEYFIALYCEKWLQYSQWMAISRKNNENHNWDYIHENSNYSIKLVVLR